MKSSADSASESRCFRSRASLAVATSFSQPLIMPTSNAVLSARPESASMRSSANEVGWTMIGGKEACRIVSVWNDSFRSDRGHRSCRACRERRRRLLQRHAGQASRCRRMVQRQTVKPTRELAGSGLAVQPPEQVHSRERQLGSIPDKRHRGQFIRAFELLSIADAGRARQRRYALGRGEPCVDMRRCLKLEPGRHHGRPEVAGGQPSERKGAVVGMFHDVDLPGFSAGYRKRQASGPWM